MEDNLASKANPGYNFLMKTGTIFAGLALLCCQTGCTKKPAPVNKHVGGYHAVGIEVAKEVMVGKETTATATWKGGTPPFEIAWSFPGTSDRVERREASSPDTITFVITARDAKFGQRCYVRAIVTDADSFSSVIQELFIFVKDPAKQNPGMFRATTDQLP